MADPYSQPGVSGGLQRPKGGSDELQPIVIKFGGGINTRELAEDLEDRECALGSANFNLDLFSAGFVPRKPFDLVGTAPNGQQINGYAQLQKQDGTLSTLIQAGTTLYAWDGTTFTSVATVAGGARLRGKYNANFPLLNKVLITDLGLQQVVSTWDGSSFAPLAHNLGVGVQFFAKYAITSQERAWFANVTAGAPTPHVVLASGVNDPTNLTAANRAGLSLGVADPFYLQAQDLSPINGFEEYPADNNTVTGSKYFSTQRGALNFIHGVDSRDISVDIRNPFIGAVGDESMIYIGNDIAYGRAGRVESLFGLINYGDVETQELSRHIADQLSTVTSWTLVYDPLLYRLYCFPGGVSQCWVYHKSIADDWLNRFYRRDGLPIRASPWSFWTTQHPLSFQPSCAWMMKRPGDGLLGVYMGDGSGNVYRMEGSGAAGDGGSQPIAASRVSKMYPLPEGDYYDVEGFVNYQQPTGPVTLSLTFQHNGINIFDQAVSIPLNSTTTAGANFFNDGATFFGSSGPNPATGYFGTSFTKRVARQRWSAAGRGSRFQVAVSATGTGSFTVNDIEVRLKARASA